MHSEGRNMEVEFTSGHAIHGIMSLSRTRSPQKNNTTNAIATAATARHRGNTAVFPIPRCRTNTAQGGCVP